MSNSSLVSYTKISPNRGNTIGGVWKPERTHVIDTITIHCVVGQCSIETLGNIFYPKSKKASSNYGVGPDGRIGMYVEEKDRSWCSSNADNDNRAITIEVASDMKDPYAVTDEAMDGLIKLLVDICKRNNIKELKWKGDKSLIGQVDKQNMTVHRWFAAKSCPGQYLYERHGLIAAEVNAKLNEGKTYYRVQTGAFRNKNYAIGYLEKVKAAGYEGAYMVYADGYYKIQVGAFTLKMNATNMAKKLVKDGFNAYVTTKGGQAVSAVEKKSNYEVAKEVVQGKWGNGSDRTNRLKKAGYSEEDIKAIQILVNELL